MINLVTWGLKRPKNHTRPLSNYTWDKDECINFVKNRAEKTMLNFSELARTHKLRNLQGKKFCISVFEFTCFLLV